jgi:hypothetical protein
MADTSKLDMTAEIPLPCLPVAFVAQLCAIR